MTKWMGAAVLALAATQDDPAETLRRDRWRGVDALVERSDEARPALERLAMGEDRDLAFYASAALAEIDALQAPGAKALVRTREASGSSARDELVPLFEAAGLRLAAGTVPDKSVDLPAGRPLLEALDLVSRRLDIEFYATAGGVWRATAGRVPGPRFAFRRFRSRLDQIRIETSDEPGRAPVSSCRLRARLSGDEGAAIHSLGGIRVIEAVDDAGRDLRPRGSGLVSYQDASEGHTFIIELKPPPAESRLLRRLRLAMEVQIEVGRGTIELSRPPAGRQATANADGVSVTILSAAGTRGGWQFQVRAEPDAALRGSCWNDARLTDSLGGAYRLESAAPATNRGATIWTVRYTNPGSVGEPETLALPVITSTFRRPLYLEFEDVPWE